MEAPRTQLHYYINFNRVTGMNRDSLGPVDKVAVTKADGSRLTPSRIVAELGDSESFTIEDFDGTGRPIEVSVLEIRENNRSPWTAEVRIAPPSTSSNGDPTCANGIENNSACCPRSCGRCGGGGCRNLPGGADNCCTGRINDSGRSCNAFQAPCAL